MANYNKMTPSKFKAIKIMLNGGATARECAEYMECSTGTVSTVRASETFEEYINNLHARHDKEKPKKKPEKPQTAPAPVKEPEPAPQQTPVQIVEHRQTVTIQATHYMMQELQRTNEYLKLISNKLAFIVDELCGTKGS